MTKKLISRLTKEKKKKGGTMIDDGVLPSRITKLAQKGDGIYANNPYGNYDPYAFEKGGIMKGQNDLDTSNIDFSNIDFSKIYEGIREKFSQKRGYIEHPQENQETDINHGLTNKDYKKKLYPRDVGKYGLLSRRKRVLLNDQNEIKPITSGEELLKDMTQYGNTTYKLKKGGILKGQDDTKIIDTRKNEDNLKYYRTNIREGYTLSDIARIYGTSVNELMKLNPEIKDENKIKAGEEIRVPYKYVLIPQGTYKLFEGEEVVPDYYYYDDIPFARKIGYSNDVLIRNPYPYDDVYLNGDEYEVDSKGNIKTYPMIVPKYYFNDDAATNAEDRYEAWKYGKEEQEFLRDNQLYMTDRPVNLPIKYLYTYHNIPDTDKGHYIVKQINGIDKSKLKPGYTINSYMYDNGLNSPVSIIRDENGRRVFVVGNEDRLVGSRHTPVYLLTIGDDFFYPDYLIQYKQGNEDRLVGSRHTPTYLLTVGDDFFYPDYLLQYKQEVK